MNSNSTEKNPFEKATPSARSFFVVLDRRPFGSDIVRRKVTLKAFYVIDFTVNATVMEEDIELKTRCEFMVFL